MAPSEYLAKATLLVVDDLPENLTLMSSLLRDEYKVKVASSGEKALRIVRSDNPPDLVLLDIMMPEMDGYQVIEQLKRDPGTQDIPVIFLTAKASIEDEIEGFELGAVDYITKPISPPIVLARVRTHIALKAAKDFLRDKARFLEDEVARRSREAIAIQDVTLLALASLAETRHVETGNHIRRTQRYVRVLAEHLKTHHRFAQFLTDATIERLFRSAPLHDIGKVGIPDRILLKPGRLDALEFEVMKTHAALGRDAISRAERSLGIGVEALRMAREITFSHHEKWDGSGYPEGLFGDAIPIPARLMALADVYDALISRNVYKGEVPHQDAVRDIAKSSGTHFDPDVADAFLGTENEFRVIAERYSDFATARKGKP